MEPNIKWDVPNIKWFSLAGYLYKFHQPSKEFQIKVVWAKEIKAMNDLLHIKMIIDWSKVELY